MSSTQTELPTCSGSFSTCWFETRLGIRYELPDMRDCDVDTLVKQLHDALFTSISCCNVSRVVLVLPRCIIQKAGVNDRCFWEAESTQLNPPGPYQKD
jgi:hypothetical protein